MLKHGLGKLIFENGDIYEGEFEADIMQGIGRYTSANPCEIYEGNFFEGSKEGLG